MSIQLRPLTDHSVGTCDWGGCDDETVQERLDPASGEWLAVCARHTGQREQRPSPGRGACPVCGKVTALSTAGRVRVHDQAFAQRCAGSGQASEPPDDPT